MNPEDLTKSIENQLFTWDEWVQLKTMKFVFYKCILSVSMLGFSAGEEFFSISQTFQTHKLSFVKFQGMNLLLKKETLKFLFSNNLKPIKNVPKHVGLEIPSRIGCSDLFLVGNQDSCKRCTFAWLDFSNLFMWPNQIPKQKNKVRDNTARQR